MFVAFPIHGVIWPQSMATAMSLLARGGTFRMYGSPWLDEVRSELVGQFLESREEELFFLDADNWVAGDLISIVETMRAANADVITCTYRKRTPPHSWVVRVNPKTASVREVDGKRVMTVDGDGLGCCLIRRRVLESMRDRYREELAYVNEGGADRVNLFEYGVWKDVKGIRHPGQEDRSFFERVWTAGFRPECLVDATVIHGSVPGNFGAEVLDAKVVVEREPGAS